MGQKKPPSEREAEAVRRLREEAARQREAGDEAEADRLEGEADKAEAPALDAPPLTDPAWGEDGWLAERPPPRPMLLTVEADKRPAPFLPLGKVGFLAAAGGAGKTQALMQLAVSVATGYDWLNAFKVETQGRVLLALGEEDREEIKRRLQKTVHAWAEGAGAEARQRILERILPLPLCGIDARLRGDDGSPTPFARGLNALLARDGEPWALVILDPAARFMSGADEKDNAAATRFVEACERLTQTTQGGPTVLVSHHTGKQGVRGDIGGDDQYLARGSSALVDGARWAVNLRWWDLKEDARAHLGSALSERRFLHMHHVKSNYTPVMRPPLGLAMDDGILEKMTEAEVGEVKTAERKAADAQETERKRRARETTRQAKAAEKAAQGWDGS